MGRAKDLIIKPISGAVASKFVKSHHYSGKVAANSSLHFGVFLDGYLGGVMQYGSSIDKRRTINIVEGTKWFDYLELNRMAFSDRLPKNSESRAIAMSFKLIKKHYPNVEWILSFADGCQCGDGTIYRASGFNLVAIKKNKTMLLMPTGETVADIAFNLKANKTYKGFKKTDCKALVGFQLKYIYFINKEAKQRLTVPILPFTDIDKYGAGMYKGERRTKHKSNAVSNHETEGGSIPTSTLQSNQKAINKI